MCKGAGIGVSKGVAKTWYGNNERGCKGAARGSKWVQKGGRQVVKGVQRG